MKLTISSGDLTSHMQAISKVVSSKSVYPILECLLFNVKDGKMTITASDNENVMITSLDCISNDADGVFAITAKSIIDSVKEIPDQPITFDINTETLEIIVTYQNGKFSLMGQEADIYPLPQALDGDIMTVNVPAKTLFANISRCMFAVANDELRPVMNGIYFDITPEGTTFVSSDGHKLVRCKSANAAGNEKAAFILPQKAASLLKGLLTKDDESNVKIDFNGRNAVFTMEDSIMHCRLIEGRYPNYNTVIPTDNPYRLTIDRAAFIGALRRVLIFASMSSALVKLKLAFNSLTISSQDIDFSTSAEEQIPCSYDGEELSIGFKGTFLLDILNNMVSNEVTLELADPSRAGVIIPSEQDENEDVLTILMPMMLND